VKAERRAFQFPPRFLFLIWRVQAEFEWFEVPSSSSEDSSSSPSGNLNLSNLVASAAMERVSYLSVGTFPLTLPVPLPLPFPPWEFPTFPRFRCLRRNVFFCSGARARYSLFSKKRSSNEAFEIFEIPEEPHLPCELLPTLPRAKLTSETLSWVFSIFICLLKVEYNSTVEAKSSHRDGLAITCVLQTSSSVVLMPLTLDESSMPE
jgi:hypothetical protein